MDEITRDFFSGETSEKQETLTKLVLLLRRRDNSHIKEVLFEIFLLYRHVFFKQKSVLYNMKCTTFYIYIHYHLKTLRSVISYLKF